MAEFGPAEDIFPKGNSIAGLCNPRFDGSVALRWYGYSDVDYPDILYVVNHDGSTQTRH